MNEPRPLSIVLAYYENAGMLERQVDNLAALPEGWAEAITAFEKIKPEKVLK